jgi:hypothetical protein
MRLDQLHFRIQHEQRGTSTCTQLNDLLRSIGDAAALIALLPSGEAWVNGLRCRSSAAGWR